MDDLGRIYIQRDIAYRDDYESKNIVDTFGKNGYFLYRTSFPQNACVIRDGFLYDYEVNIQDALEYVKRYKIKNWDQIKSSR